MTRAKEKLPKLQPDDPAQYSRFLEMAREAGATDSKEAADKAFKAVVAIGRPKNKD